jgi:hypothetical protein
MSAGSVALAGSAQDIADNPNLMDVFFGVASPRTEPAA